MKEQSEIYRARCAQYLLCSMIEDLEELLEKMDDKYGELDENWLALLSVQVAMERDKFVGAFDGMPEFIVGRTPTVIRTMRRSDN